MTGTTSKQLSRSPARELPLLTGPANVFEPQPDPQLQTILKRALCAHGSYPVGYQRFFLSHNDSEVTPTCANRPKQGRVAFLAPSTLNISAIDLVV